MSRFAVLTDPSFARHDTGPRHPESPARNAAVRQALAPITAQAVRIKQRIARPEQGKSKGYRAIILFRRGAKAVFVYGFAKNKRANIDEIEEKQFKEAAKHILALTEKQLAELLKRGEFVEVKTQ